MRIRHFGWLFSASACLAMALCVTAPVTAQAAKSNDSVNLELKDTEVKSAIEVLFRNTGKNFSIDQNVQGTIAALSIKDVPFDVALKSLAKSAGLVYRVDGGVYIIGKKPDVSTTTTLSTPHFDTSPVDEPTTEPEIRIEKIALNNVSASDILSILTGQDRGYGGYGLGSGYSGYGGGYGNNRYGGGYGGGYGSGYGSGYGMNSGYGNNRYGGGYNSYGGGYGTRSYGYGGSASGVPGGYSSGYSYRGW